MITFKIRCRVFAGNYCLSERNIVKYLEKFDPLMANESLQPYPETVSNLAKDLSTFSKNIGRNGLEKFPEKLAIKLFNVRFTSRPELLVYIHLAQVINHGKADIKLVDRAMQINPAVTCALMLALDHCTEKMGDKELMDRLMKSTAGQLDQLHKHWVAPDYYGLYTNCVNPYRASDPEMIVKFQLSLSKLLKDKIIDIAKTVPFKIMANLLQMQGRVDEANEYLSQALKLYPKESQNSKIDVNDYYVRRKDVNPCYQAILACETTSTHPIKTRTTLNQLTEIWMQLNEITDPTLYAGWVNECSLYIGNHRYESIHPSQCKELLNKLEIAIQRIQNQSKQLLFLTEISIKNLVNRFSVIKQKEYYEQLNKQLFETKSLMAKYFGESKLKIISDDQAFLKTPEEHHHYEYYNEHCLVPALRKINDFSDDPDLVKQLLLNAMFDLTVFILGWR